MSSKSVQDLIVKLVADGKEFKSSLETASGNAQTFAKNTNTAMTDSKKSVKILQGAVAGLALTIAGSSVAVLKLAADNAQAVTEMDRVAKSMDVNTTRFDKLAFAASQYGVGQDDFTQLLSDTSERITELVTIGSGEALDMFEQLNISVDEFKGLKPDEMFLKMMEALSQVSSQTERNLYLQQIAGDTGQRLSEVAEDGAKSFVELANSMGDYGGALSEDMIKESKELDKILKTLSATGSITLRNSLISLTPVVKEVSEYFEDWSKNVSIMFDKMRDNPLSDDGLALKITEDRKALKQLQEDLVEFQAKSKYGYNYGIFSDYSGTNEAVVAQIKKDIDSVTERLEKNQEAFKKSRFGNVWDGKTENNLGTTAPTTVTNQGGENTKGTGFKKPLGAAADSEQIDRNLKIIKSALASELDVEKKAYQERIDWINKAHAAKKVGDDEKTELLLANKLAHEERITAIEGEEEAKRIQRANEARQFEDQQRRDRWNAEIAELQGFHSLKEAEEAAHEDRKRGVQLKNAGQYGQVVDQFVELDRSSGADRVAIGLEIGGKLTEQAATSSKKAFRLHQVVSAGQALVSTYLAASKALELGPIAGPIAAGAITAMGLMNVMAIKNQPVPDGVAHGGLGYVRDDATYFLQRGESVLSPKQNIDVSRAAEKINTGQSGGNVNVNLIEDASRAGQYEQSSMDDEQIINVFVSNIRYGGDAASIMESTYGVQRTGS
ncbi:hypothetical protein [Pseudoalteromonas sp. GW168-MNA-CIBAN-0100]|uniref:hypothetical protein n=1 Tax=Pseudoalteromonas sp. GW168-MNA-CIBAN-0100 TaxID=3140434 RepID=UPI003331FA8C